MKRLLVAGLALLFSLPAAAQQTPLNLGTVNNSVTIATGNTFQNVLAANPSTEKNKRKSLTIENNNTTSTDNCWIAFGTRANGTPITAGVATKGESILLAPGQAYTRYYPYIPSDLIVGTCVTSSNTLYVDVQ